MPRRPFRRVRWNPRIVAAPAVCLAAAAWAGLEALPLMRAETARTGLETLTTADAAYRDRAEAAVARALAGGSDHPALADARARHALTHTPPDLETARTWTERALAQAPADAAGWARLAYIDVLDDGTLSADGAAALDRSFAAAPFGPEAFQRWRLAFTLTHWGDASAASRAAAETAAGAFALDINGRRWLATQIDRLDDPAARALVDWALFATD